MFLPAAKPRRSMDDKMTVGGGEDQIRIGLPGKLCERGWGFVWICLLGKFCDSQINFHYLFCRRYIGPLFSWISLTHFFGFIKFIKWLIVSTNDALTMEYLINAGRRASASRTIVRGLGRSAVSRRRLVARPWRRISGREKSGLWRRPGPSELSKCINSSNLFFSIKSHNY